MSDIIGRTFNGYQVIEQIGRGGMATVYKAYQPSLDRYVALKFLPPYYSHQDDSFLERFKREARVVASMRHPNILMVMDFGQEEDMSFIVMDYVEAGTLKERIQQPLNLSEISTFISQIGSALDYAHGEGVIHRDVKPSNVLLPKPDWALLTDFGLARMVGGSLLTQSGLSVGTPAYMAPEQGSGDTVDARSDVYSLGVMVYEMTTGEVPYTAETPMAVMVKHIVEPLPVPRERNPNLLEELERIVLKSMAKDADDRYQTAGELAAALESVADQHPDWSSAAHLVPASVAKTKVDPAETREVPVDDDLPSPRVSPSETIRVTDHPSIQKTARRLPFARILIPGFIVVIVGIIGFFAYPNIFGGSDSSSQQDAEANETMNAAMQFLENGQIDEALVGFETALSNTPDQWEIFLAVVYDLQQNGQDVELAIRLLENGLEVIDQSEVDAVATLGQWYFEIAEFQQAHEAYLQAIDITPNDPWLYIYLAEVSLELEDRAEVIAAVQQAVDHSESNSYLLDSAGWLAYRAEDYPLAAQVFELAIGSDDSFAWSYLGLAEVFVVLQENLDEVPDLLQTAIGDNQQDPGVLEAVGWLYYQLQDCDQATQYFEQALSLDSQLRASQSGLESCIQENS